MIRHRGCLWLCPRDRAGAVALSHAGIPSTARHILIFSYHNDTMRSASGRFHLGLGKRANTDDRAEREREVSGSDHGAGDARVVSGSSNSGFGGRMGTGALLRGKVAHTAIVSSHPSAPSSGKHG